MVEDTVPDGTPEDSVPDGTAEQSVPDGTAEHEDRSTRTVGASPVVR